jgi:hypothetical protein
MAGGSIGSRRDGQQTARRQAAATLTVFTSRLGFADLDRDRFGSGAAMALCTHGSLPAGFAPTGTDCAPGDATAWQVLTFRFRDEDGDGAVTPETGSICTGAALPADHEPTLTHFAVLYPDRDGDGVGAPPRQTPCIGDTIPAGLVAGDTDELVDLIVNG